MLTLLDISSIEKIINYSFNNRALLVQALTKKSFSKDNPDYKDNEVLEFYGDKILSFIIAYKLCNTFGSIENLASNQYKSIEQEGSLTSRFSENTKNETLSNKIKESGLLNYVLKSPNDPIGFKSAGDIFESILGAVALDSNWSLPCLSKVVDAVLKPEENFQKQAINFNDFIFRLTELCKEKDITLSEIQIQKYKPDYISKLQLEYNGEVKSFKQKAKSEKGASLAICRRAYIFINLFWLHEPVEEWIINPISQLQELLNGKVIDSLEFIPEATESYKHSKTKILWHCKCVVTIDSNEISYTSKDFPNQKQGKLEASRNILTELLFQLKRKNVKGQGLMKLIAQMGY